MSRMPTIYCIERTNIIITAMSTASGHSVAGNGRVRIQVFHAAAFLAVLFIFGGAHTAFAAVTVTPATGGGAISADTNTTNGTAIWTTLTGPSIAEGAYRDFPASGTFILNAPSGFSFNTGATVTSVISRYAGTGTCFRFTSTTATPTASTITFTLNARDGGSNTTRCQVDFSNIQVRPTAGTPLASRNIVKTGTASVSGITNGVTNLGTLTEVAGAASKLAFTTQPGSAVYGSALSTQPVVVSQDQFGNPSTSGLGVSKTVTLTLTSGTGTLQGVTALDIGTGAGNGTVTFSGLKVSAAGTGKAITASATGLTNAVSNTFSISALPVVLSGTRVYDTTATAAYSILSVSNKVGSDDVTVASGSGTLASANAGVQSITSFGTLALGGTTAGNYTFTGGSGTVTITKATPTLSVTNSPVTYDGATHAATVAGSVPGTPSNILTGGAATQTNAGTYAVTANFVPNDTTNYNSLTGASAGDFVINKADQTITFAALPDKTLGDPDFAVSATASSGLPVSFSSLTTGVCTVTVATVHLVSTGTCTIRASQAGDSNYNAATPVDRSFMVNLGVLDHFAIAAIGTQTAGTPFSITITAKDAYDNTLAGYTGTVDLATTAGTIVPTQSGAFVGGVRTESVTVSLAGTGKTITVTDHGGTKTGASSPFTVNPGALDHFSFAAIGSQVAGTPFSITMTAQDASGNTVTGYAGTVDLVTTAGTIAPTQSGTFSGGIRTESVTVTGAGSGKTITATDHGGTAAGTSAAFSVAAGAVASFTLSDPGDMYARTRLGYTVSRQDAYGNSVSTATTTVYLYTTSAGGAAKFYTDSLGGSVVTSIDIGSGHSTADVWYYDETPGTYIITASDATPAPDGATGIADATDSVTVMPVATKFVILPPANGTVDAPIAVTVEAQKPDGSIDTNYQNDVTLTASGSATGGGRVDIINGVGTKDISDTVAETVNLSLSDTESTGLDVSSTRSVAFAGGAIAQFTLTHPAASAAGTRAAYTIAREDQYGNASSLATSTVYLYSSSTGANKKFYDAATAGNVITSVTIPDGQTSASVWYYDELPGTWTITASDHSPSPDGNIGINDAVDSHQVTAGAVASFALNDPGDMTAGTRLGYTVTRKDQFGNAVTSGGTIVYLSSDSVGSSTPAFYDAATAGNVITSVTIPDGQSSAAMWYFDPNPGTWTVTASDSSPADGAIGITDATDSVTVSAAPIVATRFVIVPPVSGTVDAPVTVTIRAEDGSGNLDTTYQQDVTLVASGSATGAGLVDIIDGVGTKTVSDTVAETVNLSLADSQSTGLSVSSTRSLSFAPGAVAQFELDNPGDVAAGTRIGYTVSRKDQYGNLVTAGATDVYLYSSSTGVNKKFYDAATGGSAITSIVIPGGSSSVGFWAYDEKAGDWFITASDNASAPDTSGIIDASDALTVQPAAVAKLLLNDPGGMTAGTRLGYTVSREDQFGNPVTSGVTLAYLYSSSTGTTTAFYSAAVDGAPTAFATINDGSSSGAFWYYDETPGTWNITASDSSVAPNGSTGLIDAVDSVTVSAIPIHATRFVISPVTTVQVGTPATVTVRAEDGSGNLDTTYQQDVTLAASGSATGAGLVDIVDGVGTKVLTDTVAETVNLSLSDTESTGLDTASTRSLTFSATPVAPATGGGAGGGVVWLPAPVVTGVRISGRAFPGAQVTVLALSPEGATITGKTTASTNGAFSALLTGVGAGAGSYSVAAADALGRTTQTKILTANYRSVSTLLALDASVLSPTLGLVNPVVRRGDVVGVVGNAAPGYTVRAQIDGGAAVLTGRAAADGSYKILFPTAAFALGSHTVRVQQVSPAGIRSDYSPQKVFIVTTLFTPQTDFNQDGVVNIQDWSVFLARWSSPIASVRLLDDLNGDGKVDVTDLSIFVRTLKR